MRDPPVLAGRFCSPSGARGRSARTHVRAVDAPQVPIDPAVLVQTHLQAMEDRIQRAIASPADEAVVNALPAAVALGHLTPLSAAVQNPEDPVERQTVVVPLTAAAAVARQQIFDQLELL